MAQYAFVSLLYIFGCIYASAAELPVNNIEPVETARLEPHSDRILHVTQHRQLQADTSGNAKYVCSDIELEETESCSECEDGVDNDGDGIEDCGDVDCQFTYHCKMERANENSFNNTAATWRAIWIVILVSLVPLGVAAWAQLKDLKYHRHIKGNTQVIGRSQIDGVVNPSALSESLSGPNGTTENGVVDDSAPRLTLSVGYLDYWVNVKMNAPGLAGLISKSTIQRKQLLRDFTASFPPNTLTGIMGPSGCGKTVLLNLLSGRQKTGEFSGLRMVNGEAMSMNRFRAVMQQQGYVRQEDTFFEDLTVRDTLLYSSMLGLPEETSIADKMSRVDSVLAEIGLTGAADAKVGGLKFKGISGGQKRRLSIAIELVRAPSILLLDEPTSGLDATTSLKLVRSLSDLAKQGGRAVIASLQQPRAEIFEALDQILLLGKGGTVVYFGPASECVASLAVQGLDIDPKDYDNPGDFIIDAVGLDPERDSNAGGGEENSTELADQYARGPAQAAALKTVAELMENAHAFESGLATTSATDRLAPAYATSFAHQLWVLFSRRYRSITSDPFMVAYLHFQNVTIAFVVGYAFSYEAADEETATAQQPYKSLMVVFCYSAYAAVLQYLVLVPEYGADRPVLLRERDSGLCRMASYLLSAALLELPRAFVYAITLWVIGALMTDMNTQLPYAIFSILTLTIGTNAWQGLCAACCCCSDKIAVAYNLIFVFLGVGTLFGGLCVHYSNIPPYFLWGYYTSIPAATSRALIINEYSGLHISMPCETLIKFFYADAGRGVDAIHEKMQNPASAAYIAEMARAAAVRRAAEAGQPDNLAAAESAAPLYQASSAQLVQLESQLLYAQFHNPDSLPTLTAQMCDETDETIDLGLALMRQIELDLSDAQGILISLLAVSLAMRGVCYIIMMFREFLDRDCKELDSTRARQQLRTAGSSSFSNPAAASPP